MRRIVTLTLNPALDISTETPEVAPDVKLRCVAPRFDPGGGGVNVSRAIAFLGGDSVLALALGGATGAQMSALLRAEGLAPVDLGVAHPTRQSLAVRETSTGRQFRFLLPGPDWSAEDAARARDAVVAMSRAGDLTVASGSLPPGVAEDFYGALKLDLRAQGARMILDTSGAALAAVAHGPVAPLYVLRMDEAEAAGLAGGPFADCASVAAFARTLAAGGVAEIVVIALGARGALAASADGCWRSAPPRVEVVSKVGAGDSFVAAMAMSLARRESVAQACAWGVAAAAAAVMTPDTRLCERATAERLHALVTTTTC